MTTPTSPDVRLARARVLARLLDSAVALPGTGVRFGLDSILGLIPGLGDVTGAAFAGYVVLLGSEMGASRAVILRMLGNVAVDTLVGMVPVLGDLFDVAWKSNMKNLSLLERSIGQDATVRPASKAIIVVAVLALAALIAGGIAVAVLVIRALVGALN